MEEPVAQIRIVMDTHHANPPLLEVAEPEAAVTPLSADTKDTVDVMPRKAKAKKVETIDDAELAPDTVAIGDASMIDDVSGAGGRKNGRKKLEEGNGLGLRVLSARSALVPIRVVAEAALENANGVPFGDRFVPPAASNPLPPTASPRATEATGRPPLVTSPPDGGGVTSPPPTVTSPPITSSPPTAVLPTAAPTTPAPGFGGLTPVRDLPVTPGVVSGLVLANFQPSALDLSRSGVGAPSVGDSGQRFVAPNTGIPVDGSTAPGRAVPLPSAGTGAGVVTEEVPDPMLPPIELVPSGSDVATPPAALVENGVTGTQVFVATVATIGILAGAYYSQVRRSGRGPRLRVR